jgi:hypothetical protein
LDRCRYVYVLKKCRLRVVAVYWENDCFRHQRLLQSIIRGE